jgi:hypothetical protein
MPLVFAIAAYACPQTISAQGTDLRPGKEVLLSREEVKDSFLGYVIGLIQTDTAARVDRDYILELLPELEGFPGLQRIREVGWQASGDPAGPALSFSFDGELDYPVPISIFGYHPGSIRASRAIVLREVQRGSGGDALAGPFHLFEVEQGYARVDFDEWLDVVAGRLLDDFSLAAIEILTFHGRWHALLVGRGARDQPVAWVLDLSRNQIVFPVPRELASHAGRILAGAARP